MANYPVPLPSQLINTGVPNPPHSNPLLMHLMEQLLAIRQARTQLAINRVIQGNPRFYGNMVLNRTIPQEVSPTQARPSSLARNAVPINNSYVPPGPINPGLFNWLVSPGFYESNFAPSTRPTAGPIAY